MSRTYWIDNVGEYDLAGFMRDVYEGEEYANPLDNDLLDNQYSTVAGMPDDDTDDLWDESDDTVGFYDISGTNTEDYLKAVNNQVGGPFNFSFGGKKKKKNVPAGKPKTYVLAKESDCWKGAKLKTVSAFQAGRNMQNEGGFYYKKGKKYPLPKHINWYDKVVICWEKRGSNPASSLFKAASKNPTVKASAKLGGDIVNAANNVARLPAKAIKKTLGNVPYIGTPIKALVNLTPEEAIGGLSTRIIRGERIDKAFLRTAKAKIKDAKTLAPYVQTVLSVVPGVGTGVSAAIGAGVALAEGRTITDAVMSSVKGALPGGPAAAMAFDTGVALAHGKRIDKAALNAVKNQLPPAARRVADIGMQLASGSSVSSVALKQLKQELPPAAAEALDTGLKVAKNPAQREAIIKEAVMRGVQSKLPPAAREGLDVGIAMASGRNIQSTVVNKVASKAGAEKVYSLGKRVFGSSRKAQRSAKGLSRPRLAGYKAGLGAISASGMNAHALAALRQRLPETQRAGFDHALKSTLNAAKPELTSLVVNGRILRGEWRPVDRSYPGAVKGRMVRGNRVIKGFFTREPKATKADMAALAKLTPRQQAQLRALAAARK